MNSYKEWLKNLPVLPDVLIIAGLSLGIPFWCEFFVVSLLQKITTILVIVVINNIVSLNSISIINKLTKSKPLPYSMEIASSGNS